MFVNKEIIDMINEDLIQGLAELLSKVLGNIKSPLNLDDDEKYILKEVSALLSVAIQRKEFEDIQFDNNYFQPELSYQQIFTGITNFNKILNDLSRMREFESLKKNMK